MKTVNIKGKEYVEVNERVKYFRENYEDWAIETELISNDNAVCVIKAIIKNADGVVKATGLAYEKENDKNSFVNATSYIENCETSAVGRALGFLGIGIDTSIASSEEVQTAINKQKSYGKPETAKGLDFTELWEKYKNMSKEDLRKEYQEVKDYQGWSDKQKEAVLNIIERCANK
jgi:hypothetical protein